MRRRLFATCVLVLMIAAVPRAYAQRLEPSGSEVFLINYQARAKDAAAATALSIVPGFGMGHFYAESYASGVAVAGGEILGLGLALLGAAVGDSGETAHDVLQIVGALLFAAFKIADTVYAPYAVADYNQMLVGRLRVPVVEPIRYRGRGYDLPTEPAKKKPLPEQEGEFQY